MTASDPLCGLMGALVALPPTLDVFPGNPLIAIANATRTVLVDGFKWWLRCGTQCSTSHEARSAFAQRSKNVRRRLTRFFFSALRSPQRSPTTMQYFEARVNRGIQPVTIRKEMGFVAKDNTTRKLAPLCFVGRERISELEIQYLFIVNMPVSIAIEIDDVTDPATGFDFGNDTDGAVHDSQAVVIGLSE